MSGFVRDGEDRLRGMMQARSPIERLTMACRMFATARTLMLAGMGETRGGEPRGAALRARLFVRLYGGDFDSTQSERILEHLRATGCTGAGDRPDRP